MRRYRRLYVRTPDCQYTRPDGTVCGRPPNWLHLPSKRAFCSGHYALACRVHHPWVNLERKDAALVIASYDARHPNI